MTIYPSEWLSLSKEIKVKLIRLAILENEKRGAFFKTSVTKMI
ncbi:hypothetical protein [Neobacillus fumarioli]|nr:hypothetical protein [Neobacillus fumarioli]